jgi:acyl carrier protein
MIEQKVTEACREVFGDPDLVIGEATTAADIEGWDSFNHINLLMHLEADFDISFSTREIGAITRVGDLFRLIEEKTMRV